MTIADILTQAVRLYRTGNKAGAEALFLDVLQRDPNQVDAWHLVGLCQHDRGRTDLAESSIRRALAIRPDLASAHFNLGNILRDVGRRKDAIGSYRLAVHHNPEQPEALYNLANILREEGDIKAAEGAYRQALRYRPDYVRAAVNLGKMLQVRGHFQEAIQVFRIFLASNPGNARALCGLGGVLSDVGETEEALRCCRAGVTAAPGDLDLLNALVGALTDAGKPEEALALCSHGLRHNPEHAALRLARAFLLLRAGEWNEGLLEYEWRWKIGEWAIPKFGRPRWDGSPLEGRTLLLHGEQGHGDTIQFVRYAELAKSRGGRIVVQAPRPLLRLISTCSGIDELCEVDAPTPSFDLFSPLLSLPGIFGATPTNIPNNIPYLFADEADRSKWRQRLAGDIGCRVGLVWAGNPNYPLDRRRSFPVETFQRLRDLSGVRLYSLQKGTPTSTPHWLVDLAPELKDFADTAALLSELDLVIGCDTATVHLAGALGVPVWIIVSAVPDWRWGATGDTTPWYPTMRIFRQKNLGSWEDVAVAVSQELAARRVSQRRVSSAPKGRVSIHCPGLLSRPGVAIDPTAQTHAQGAILLHQGRLGEALALFDAQIIRQPEDVEARFGRAIVLGSSGKNKEAEEEYRQIVKLDPGHVSALTNLGALLGTQGRLEEALLVHRQAAHVARDFPQARLNIAGTLNQLGRWEEAATILRELVESEPKIAAGHLGLGITAAHLGAFSEAVQSFTRALNLEPDLPGARFELTLAHLECGHPELAEEVFREGLRICPTDPVLRKNRAMNLLRLDRANPGWLEYEWRHRPDLLARILDRPVWDGGPLDGRSVLLQAEQGLGDTIQFVRFAQNVSQRGGRVVLRCQKELVEVLRSVPGIDEILPDDVPPPATSCMVLLMSLPGILGLEVTPTSSTTPYLRAKMARRSAWRARLAAIPGKKVGIVWRGNPRHERDALRSLPLMAFAPLATVPGISLISLQKGPIADELQNAQSIFRVVDVANELQDFRDTAALLCELDLLITCDTSVAHLAGALGVNAWVLLPMAADWRWGVNRNDTPWYPSVGLFRQQVRGDWVEVCQRVANALRDHFVLGPSHLFQEALRAVNAGRNTEGEALHRRVLSVDPNHLLSLINLGGLCVHRGTHEEAEAFLLRALHLKSDQDDAHYNLGLSYWRRDRLEDAERHLRAAALVKQVKPERALALANVLACRGRGEEGLAVLRNAVRYSPNDDSLRTNLAIHLLRLGHFAEGWKEYEARLQGKIRTMVDLPGPRWDGSSIEGRTLFTYHEQGLGDTIQFVRYAGHLAQGGARIILRCPESLRDLLRTCPGVFQVVSEQDPLPQYDVHAPLPSLPGLCGSNLENLPSNVPYCFVDPQRKRLLNERFMGLKGRRIGLVWRGNPRHQRDHQRSFPMETFEPLKQFPNIRLVSLQKGLSDQDSQAMKYFEILDISNNLNDFMDTAAVIELLDLVITCDTSVAHLAGALAKPVWVLLPFILPDWRWLLDRSDSPWYPTMRLFRQPCPGDWTGAMKTIVATLRDWESQGWS